MVNDIKETAKKRMDGVIDQLNTNLSSVRTGRANAMILDRVKAPDAHTLVIEPWDKSSLGAIEAAIMNANLGVNPNNDGQVIRLPFPSLTEERRKELAKQCKTYAEEGRIAIRNARRDANTEVEKSVKEDNLPEDEKRRAEEEIQKLTDSYVAKIDDILKKKEDEVMTV